MRLDDRLNQITVAIAAVKRLPGFKKALVAASTSGWIVPYRMQSTRWRSQLPNVFLPSLLTLSFTDHGMHRFFSRYSEFEIDVLALRRGTVIVNDLTPEPDADHGR
jgi:hypothetical protein